MNKFVKVCFIMIMILKDVICPEKETTVEDPLAYIWEIMDTNSQYILNGIEKQIKKLTDIMEMNNMKTLKTLEHEILQRTGEMFNNVDKDIMDLSVKLSDSISFILQDVREAIDMQLQEVPSSSDIRETKNNWRTYLSSLENKLDEKFQMVEKRLIQLDQSVNILNKTMPIIEKNSALVNVDLKNIDKRLTSINDYYFSNNKTLNILKADVGNTIKSSLISDNKNDKDLSENIVCETNTSEFVSERDCSEVQINGGRTIDLHFINPTGIKEEKTPVICEHGDGGLSWSVILRRGSMARYRQDFNRTMEEYVNGFGGPLEEYWLGLRKMAALTNRRKYELQINMEDIDGTEIVVNYGEFGISNSSSGYALHVKNFSCSDSSVRNALGAVHKGQRFSTWDNDMDGLPDFNCAARNGGGWWYDECHQAVLTAVYPTSDNRKLPTIRWKSFDKHISWYVLRSVFMKIRPTD